MCRGPWAHSEVLVGGPGGSILRRVPGPAAHGKGWSVRCVPPPGTRRIVVTLPCAKPMAHGKVTTIRRVPVGGTRRTDQPLPCATGPGTRRSMLPPGPQPGLRRVSHGRHTANLSPSPCVTRLAHGKVNPLPSTLSDAVCYLYFTVCPIYDTRRTPSSPCQWLPSALRRRPPMAKFSSCAKWASPCALGTRRNEEIRWCVFIFSPVRFANKQNSALNLGRHELQRTASEFVRDHLVTTWGVLGF